MRIFAVLVMLVLILTMLDLLSNSGEILAVPGNGQAQLARYVGLSVPGLIQTFLPYSVLLATIITLATLNQNSEVIAMKAAGLSAHQVLAPLLLTALLVSLVNFAFNERVVTRANATMSAWEANEFAPIPPSSDVRANVYIADGPDILTARSITGSGAEAVLQGVTWYRFGPQDLLIEQIDSPRATYASPGWKLQDAERFTVQSAKSENVGTVTIGQSLTTEQLDLATVNPNNTSFFELSGFIDAYEAAGRRTAELRAKWWHKLSGPLSTFLMPLLGAVAAFGLARSGKLFVRAIIGMALGFAYFVFDNMALAMGSFGGYPPLLAAWAPFVLFALIGETVLIRTEE